MRHIAGSRAGEESDLMPKYSAINSEQDDEQGGRHNFTCGVAIEEGSQKSQSLQFQPNVASHIGHVSKDVTIKIF